MVIAWKHLMEESEDYSLNPFAVQLLAFLLVFRCNQAFGYWWEGRILMGQIDNSLREILLDTHAYSHGISRADERAQVTKLQKYAWVPSKLMPTA